MKFPPLGTTLGICPFPFWKQAQQICRTVFLPLESIVSIVVCSNSTMLGVLGMSVQWCVWRPFVRFQHRRGSRRVFAAHHPCPCLSGFPLIQLLKYWDSLESSILSPHKQELNVYRSTRVQSHQGTPGSCHRSSLTKAGVPMSCWKILAKPVVGAGVVGELCSDESSDGAFNRGCNQRPRCHPEDEDTEAQGYQISCCSLLKEHSVFSLALATGFWLSTWWCLMKETTQSCHSLSASPLTSPTDFWLPKVMKILFGETGQAWWDIVGPRWHPASPVCLPEILLPR